MTVQFYFKPTNLEEKMNEAFSDVKQEIVDNLVAKISEQKAIEVDSLLIEISKEDHEISNFRIEIRLIPLKSTRFDEIRVVEEDKQYLPAFRHAAHKVVEILMEMKARVIE